MSRMLDLNDTLIGEEYQFAVQADTNAKSVHHGSYKAGL